MNANNSIMDYIKGMLIPEQEALIAVDQDKWEKIALSTERLDRKKAEEAVKAAYTWIHQGEPEIMFFDSPYAALRELNILDFPFDELPIDDLLSQLRHPFTQETQKLLYDIQLQEALGKNLWNRLWKVQNLLYFQIEEKLDEEDLWIPDNFDNGIVNINLLNAECADYDFCISVLNFDYESTQWQILQDIVKNCGWVFTCQDACIVCDRPIKFSFDNAKLLHAEAEPAIEFADGFKVYAHHGEWLSQKC